MMLRTRVTLLVAVAFLAVAGVLVFDARTREQNAERRYADALIDSQRNAWSALSEAELHQFGGWASELANDEEIVQAFVKGDDTALKLAFTVIANRLHDSLPDADVEVVRTDGRLAYTSSGLTWPNLLTGQFLDQTLRQPHPPTGLKRLNNGHFALVLGFPILARGGALGAVGMTIEVEKLLPLLSGPDKGRLMFVDPDGKAAETTASVKWDDLKIDLTGVAPHGEVRHVDLAGQRLAVVLFALPAMTDGAPPWLASVRDFSEDYRWTMLISGLVYGTALAVVLLFLGVLHWYLRSAFRPLGGARRALKALAVGEDGGASLPSIRRNDEIGRMVGTVGRLEAALLDLRAKAVAQQRTASEVAFARDIQRRMQPSHFSFPDHPEFDLHAVIEPARTVGGNLYDFFLIDDRRLCFMVGDISERGAAAALFMAVSKTLLKSLVQTSTLPLEEVLAQVNRYLVQNNPTDMFITLVICVLDLGTGALMYGAAGHQTPCHLRIGSLIDPMGGKSGLALGIIEDSGFHTDSLQLLPGDAVVLYTNGVNEAVNDVRARFDAGRIIKVFAGLDKTCDAARITGSLLLAVQRFVGIVEQDEDISILAVRWWGPDGRPRSDVAGQTAEASR
jgi:sigma-B regulation protein RsbU (phosphoserine phosphatase)